MKLIRYFLALLFFIFLIAPNTQAANEATNPALASPPKIGAPGGLKNSNPAIQNRIEQERTEIQKQMQAVSEATAAIQETQNAVNFIDAGDKEKATTAMTNAVGKIDVLLAQHPDMALIPVTADIRVIDMVADQKAIHSITTQAKFLMNQGNYQAARRLLRNFASEINITSTNIPMGTYPMAIREAASLLKEGRNVEAKADLQTALHSLVTIERSVPLPIVKAQALIDEVQKGVIDKKLDNAQAQQFLDEATDQLKLAEAMGYGKTKQDFAPMLASIQDIKRNINQNRDNKGILSRLKSDLENIRKRII